VEKILWYGGGVGYRVLVMETLPIDLEDLREKMESGVLPPDVVSFLAVQMVSYFTARLYLFH
jgi:hypothetical protein